MERIKKCITDLLPKSNVDASALDALRRCGLRSDNDGLISGGITINFSPNYPAWASDEKKRKVNEGVSKLFIDNRHLFPFVRCHFLSSLEDIAMCRYTIGFSVKIADVETFGNNCLVMFSGVARTAFDKEAYYNSTSFDDFIEKIEAISALAEDPTMEHEPIILQQHNGMCGNSFERWEVEI